MISGWEEILNIRSGVVLQPRNAVLCIYLMQCISNLHNLKLCPCGFSCSDGGGLSFLLLDRWTVSGSKVTNSWPRSVKGKSTKNRNLIRTANCTCYTWSLLSVWTCSLSLIKVSPCAPPVEYPLVFDVQASWCFPALVLPLRTESVLRSDSFNLSKTTQASSQTTYIHLGSRQWSRCCPIGRASAPSTWRAQSQTHLRSS